MMGRAMSQQQPIEVSVLIVNWNAGSLLSACLSALYGRTQHVRFETWVIDNHSHDGSVAMIQEAFPDVQLIHNETNRGFAAACNQALSVASGRYVMLLNPDTEVRPNALGALVRFLDAHPEAGGAGPKLLYPDGHVQRIGFYRKVPSLLQVVLFYTPLKWITKRSRILKGRYWEHQDHTDICEVDQPPGAALMVRRQVLDQVGELDERFFLYFEDVDWCYRMRRAGWRLYFVPSAEIIHHVGGTTAQLGLVVRRSLFAKSMIQFFRKHHGWVIATLVAVLVMAGAVVEYTIALLVLPFAMFTREQRQARFGELWRLLSGDWRKQLHPSSAHSTPLLPEAMRNA